MPFYYFLMQKISQFFVSILIMSCFCLFLFCSVYAPRMCFRNLNKCVLWCWVSQRHSHFRIRLTCMDLVISSSLRIWLPLELRWHYFYIMYMSLFRPPVCLLTWFGRLKIASFRFVMWTKPNAVVKLPVSFYP